MSTTGQFSSKNPTIKRILKEASELANQPSSDYHAAPLETDLFEWHFTFRGPPAPSPFENGLYHGRIVLPPAYPLKPPSFRFLTPSGRFEVNREICLSISGHHEETWQPAWGIRTALVAIRSFMDTSAGGQLGGMEASEEVRRRMAGQSAGWKCAACAKSNAEVMREQDEAVREQGGERKAQETVPEELRLAYRENLAGSNGSAKEPEGSGGQKTAPPGPEAAPLAGSVTVTSPVTATGSGEPASVPAAPRQAPTLAPPPQPQRRAPDGVPAWIDKAIYGVLAALIFLVWRRWLS
ncbi:hypothetical protein LTR29_005169 [Friedmanniomyces endolithicus]|uniref:UBC core domain-containing protein n=1 Tax=Rachicladosporium monterosium TaxID=1507873 RepID=A0ABR0LI05_9PEZI|nr:hypothetical protein LTR29_005169 [Friedmanniomyces endolithicus]KAK5148213.1 hypothetical protein LTR32_000463 [Rachicladosporium monterosium]